LRIFRRRLTVSDDSQYTETLKNTQYAHDLWGNGKQFPVMEDGPVNTFTFAKIHHHSAPMWVEIVQECTELAELLCEKNSDYGNSALEPIRVFSKDDPVEQLYVRIDDKLSRIQNRGVNGSGEDTLQDLMGYLVLLRIAKRLHP
jgi:hypothetical protein